MASSAPFFALETPKTSTWKAQKETNDNSKRIRPILRRMNGMDIADVKLHKLLPAISVKELSSSPTSIQSATSFSSISSFNSTYTPVYPPEIPDDAGITESWMFKRDPQKSRLGSIDQMIEWTRNVTEDSVRCIPLETEEIPESGSQCPMLAPLPEQALKLCSSSWSKVYQKMQLQLICRGLQRCSELGLYEIRSGPGQGSFVAALILDARYSYKGSALEKRFRDIAEQEWRDIPPIRIWWVDARPGQDILPPMSHNPLSWTPIDFSGQQRKDSVSSLDIAGSKVEDLAGERLNALQEAFEPFVPRRKSSLWWKRTEDGMPRRVRDNTTLADELHAQLRKFVISD